MALLMPKVLPYLSKQLYMLRMIPSQSKLARTKRDQRQAFDALCGDFPLIYRRLKEHDISRFTTSVWERLNADIDSTLLPYPTFSFLRHPLIAATMVSRDFGHVLKQELAMLEREYSSDRLKVLLEEDYVGNPLVVNSTYLTSHNSIHHLYHLTKFANNTMATMKDINTVVEWGGGYGNLAKLFSRLRLARHTYIIIDTPFFSALQWLYLSTVFGPEGVKLLQHPGDTVQSGRINLLPLCFLDHHELSADLFVSTWALSESSRFSQDYVSSREWFKAKHLLVAYQESRADYLPDANRVGTLAAERGAVIEPIDFLPGNYYALC